VAFIFENQPCIAGYYDSDLSLPITSESEKRVVDMVELEFFQEEFISYLDGEEIHIKPGTVLRALPGCIRYSKLPLRNYFLKLPPTLPEITNLIAQMPPVWQTRYSDAYRSCFSEILIGDAQRNKYRTTAGFYALFAILHDEHKLLCTPAKKTVPNHLNEAVSLAIQYMDSHFQAHCTLDDIAAAAHLSPTYFHTIFKTVQGETPQEYLTKLRIEHAKILLSTKSCDIPLIAEQCGFSSDIYFTAVFKKYMHITPRQYRTKLMQEYWKS